jgi:hypothetical protein
LLGSGKTPQRSHGTHLQKTPFLSHFPMFVPSLSR